MTLTKLLNTYREFNELVNMTAKDLTDWLGSEESVGAGWSKDDGSGETIGHERYGVPNLLYPVHEHPARSHNIPACFLVFSPVAGGNVFGASF